MVEYDAGENSYSPLGLGRYAMALVSSDKEGLDEEAIREISLAPKFEEPTRVDPAKIVGAFTGIERFRRKFGENWYVSSHGR